MLINWGKINELNNWKLIDAISLKSRRSRLMIDTYYLDGHELYEKSLTRNDMDFINFTRSINAYGTSEKMRVNDEKVDKFYIHTNIIKKSQEIDIIEYLTKNNTFSKEQNELLNYLCNMGSIIHDDNDYRSLYFCGFSKNKESQKYTSIRFYFKTFSVDESLNNDAEYINYCEQSSFIRQDTTFSIVKKMVFEEKAKLRCIGIEMSEQNKTKIKYYLSQRENDLTDVLYYLKNYPQYENNIKELMDNLPNSSDLACMFIQLSSGDGKESGCINIYFDQRSKEKMKYYSMREGVVLRNIGGIGFLIDIHEKHYYDYKNLFSVNDIGKVIIEYISKIGTCTPEAIVSYLRSDIKDYNPEMYPFIYSDCLEFIEQLLDLHYLEEEK